MSNDIKTGLRVVSQEPLDAKAWTKTSAFLTNLGVNDNLAYSYYKGLKVYCADENVTYIWRLPLNEEEEGLLENNFVYPADLTINGINYSIGSYNFFLFQEGGGGGGEQIPIQNLNNGLGLYAGISGGAHKFRGITSNNLIVQITSEGGVSALNIDAPNYNKEITMIDSDITLDTSAHYGEILYVVADVLITIDTGLSTDFLVDIDAVSQFRLTHNVGVTVSGNSDNAVLPYVIPKNGQLFIYSKGLNDIRIKGDIL